MVTRSGFGPAAAAANRPGKLGALFSGLFPNLLKRASAPRRSWGLPNTPRSGVNCLQALPEHRWALGRWGTSCPQGSSHYPATPDLRGAFVHGATTQESKRRGIPGVSNPIPLRPQGCSRGRSRHGEPVRLQGGRGRPPCGSSPPPPPALEGWDVIQPEEGYPLKMFTA